MLLLIFNPRLIVWLPAPEQAPGELARAIQAGEWNLPVEVAERFSLARNLTLHARAAGGLVIARPHQPLSRLGLGSALELTPVQQRLVKFIWLGLTNDQIALRLGRSPRWVVYQLQRLRGAAVHLPQRSPGVRSLKSRNRPQGR